MEPRRTRNPWWWGLGLFVLLVIPVLAFTSESEPPTQTFYCGSYESLPVGTVLPSPPC